VLSSSALAQEHHAQFHDVYQNWMNKADQNCCHNQDCGVMKPEDVDDTGEAIKVRINGEWCPVKDFMMLKKGKSPDWSVAHACIDRRTTEMKACDRLLCFAGKPQM